MSQTKQRNRSLQESDKAHHSLPRGILAVSFHRAAYTLRPMDAKQAVVELSHHVIRRDEIIENPLLPKLSKIRREDGRREGSEVWLVNRNKDVFQLQSF